MLPEDLMRMAIQEAKKGDRLVRPNPKVGAAALSLKGEVVLGYHKQYGAAHAEREVAAAAKSRGISLEGATWAVTLEPCNHFGKTPPCTDLLIESKAKKVFFGTMDPHPLVSGRGIERLRQAGVEVQESVLKAECEALNLEWLTSHRQGFPFVRIKMATSLDGMWTSESGESKWITSPSARQLGHQMRSEADVLITGAGTFKRDNPAMTARLENGDPLGEVCQPKVYVLSRKESLNLEGSRLSQHPKGAEVVVLKDSSLRPFLAKLLEQGHTQILVEAGANLSHAFLEASLFNELWAFVAPKILGGEGAHFSAFSKGHLPGLDLKLLGCEKIENSHDLLIRYAPHSLT